MNTSDVVILMIFAAFIALSIYTNDFEKLRAWRKGKTNETSKVRRPNRRFSNEG